jgi:hypothetical protein
MKVITTVILGFALLICLSAICASGEIGQEDADNAAKVVEQYMKSVAKGELLTTEGWQRAGERFVHPSPPSPEGVILIIHNDYSVWKPVLKGEKADVMVGYRGVGRLDEKFRFKAEKDNGTVKTGIMYHLVKTSTQQHPSSPSSTKGRSNFEWKILNQQGIRVVTLQAAKTHLKGIQGTIADPVARQNADSSLKTLELLH